MSTAQFENAKVVFHLGQEFETIKCQCGMEYLIFAILRGDDEHTQVGIQIWPCDRTYFCPYCGEKDKTLERQPEQVSLSTEAA